MTKYETHAMPYPPFKSILVFSVRLPGVGVVAAMFLVLVVINERFESFMYISVYIILIYTPTPGIPERT